MEQQEKQPVIRVRDLKAGYGQTVILRDVNFDIYPGEVFVILGGSGCGKSTIMKHIIGLVEPPAGEIFIGKDNIWDASSKERVEILKKVGVMYQNGALFGGLSVLENIYFVFKELSDIPAEAMPMLGRIKLHLVGLEDAAYKMPAELSGGMCKRAAIARAMALDPMVVFLDEPSAGLDPITSSQLDDLIIELSRTLKITFVVVTHELPSIFKIADRVLMVDKAAGTVIAEGNPAELRDHSPNPWVRQFFNREASAHK